MTGAELELVQKIQLDLRISHTNLNGDISDNIYACLYDLELAGVKNAKIINVVANDPLLVSAVKMYCRWQYNFQGNAEQYHKAYMSLKMALSLAGDYSCTMT